MEKECNSYLVGARDNTNNSKLGAASHNNDYLTSSADNAEAERPSGKAGAGEFPSFEGHMGIYNIMHGKHLSIDFKVNLLLTC